MAWVIFYAEQHVKAIKPATSRAGEKSVNTMAIKLQVLILWP